MGTRTKSQKRRLAAQNEPVVRLSLTDRDKAAVIVGMVRAFKCGGWPAHFSADDRSEWRRRGEHAAQMLGEGVFNPLDAYAVLSLFDDEFSEI